MNADIEVLELRNLTKNYGASRGVDCLNLKLKKGEIFGFLGPNGAGKTTTIRLIIGIIKPSEGDILLFGTDHKKNRQINLARIGYLPGDLGLYGDMSAAGYLEHHFRLQFGCFADFDERQLEGLLHQYHIPLHKKIKTFSKGMRQILGILQVIQRDPDLLILDEPTSGLDPIMQEVFMKMLLEEKKKGKTIFLSSHILSEIEKICDRVGIIKEGELIQVADMNEYRRLVGKDVHIDMDRIDEELIMSLNHSANVQNLKQNGHTIKFHFNGDINDLSHLISQYHLLDFTCVSPSIEEIFFRYYRED